MTILLSRARLRVLLFHPIFVFAISLAAALLFSILAAVFFKGELRSFLLYYYAPVGVPFVAFLFDRAARRAEIASGQWNLDSFPEDKSRDDGGATSGSASSPGDSPGHVLAPSGVVALFVVRT